MCPVFAAKTGRQLHQRGALGARLRPPHLLHRQFAAEILHGFHRRIGGKERLGLEPCLARMAGLLLLQGLVEPKAIGTLSVSSPVDALPTLRPVLPLRGSGALAPGGNNATLPEGRKPRHCGRLRSGGEHLLQARNHVVAIGHDPAALRALENIEDPPGPRFAD
jgi:hypothetical protein